MFVQPNENDKHFICFECRISGVCDINMMLNNNIFFVILVYIFVLRNQPDFDFVQIEMRN